MFKRFAILAIVLCFFTPAVFSQEVEKEKKEEPTYGWDNKFIGILNLTQTTLSNWTQGGDNAWTWQANINGIFEQKEEKFNWKNTVQLLYGKSKIGSDDPKKTDDQIFLETVYTYKIGKVINPYIGGSALTQFTTGYDYSTKPATEVSGFLDPGYFREGIGAEYKPSDKFDTRLGFAMRQSIADVYAATYSDDPDTENTEKFSNQIGAESVTNFSTNVSKLIVYVTKLELFSELEAIDQTVVRWDHLISSQVADYISVSFSFKLYYEPRVSMQRQLNQTLAVGLTYSFF